MRHLVLLFAAALLALAACGENETRNMASDPAADAKRIAHETIIVDTHIDVPYRLNEKWEDISQPTGGDFDYPRAKSGGLDAPFMSIYIPAEHQETGDADAVADKLIDMVERIIRENPDKFARAVSPSDVEAAFAEGKIALPLGMENGAPIMGDLEKLRHFYDRGIRYITLAHSKANHIADSSYDENRPNGGLSDFGKTLVGAMNDIGMMIDISHVSDEAFWQVVEITEAPVIASHSSARHFTPGFERNIADDMIEAVAQTGGVVMINFGSGFLTREANEYRGPERAAREIWLEERGLELNSQSRARFNDYYRAEHPYPYADLEDVLDHIDHVVGLVGIDHVGIGSDYDGVGDTLPTGLKDVSSYPDLVRGLLERGYSEEDIEKILSGNIMRVWRTVAAHAEAGEDAEAGEEM